MVLIQDDPVIRCIENTGYAPWISEDDDDESVYDEPFAVYDPD